MYSFFDPTCQPVQFVYCRKMMVIIIYYILITYAFYLLVSFYILKYKQYCDVILTQLGLYTKFFCPVVNLFKLISKYVMNHNVF